MSVLGLTNPKSAANVLPTLVTLGLIDEAGKPTDLSKQWRDDQDYAAACAAMLESVYPASLRDAFPPPNPDPSEVRRWFMRNADVGEGAGTGMASLYCLIAQADAGQQPDSNGAATAKRTPAKAAASTKKQSDKSTPAGTPKVEQVKNDPPPKDPPDRRPKLHIDVQIHIASDASLEQIDQIFASMGKHLYSDNE